MRFDHIWYIALFGLILITIGIYIEDIFDSEQDKTYTKVVCSLYGHTDEYRKYDKVKKEWINSGSYRKDTVYKINSDLFVERGYNIVFTNKDDYKKLDCLDILNSKCDSEDEIKLTKYVKSMENMYDFMDLKFEEMVESLESNGYNCIKE